MGKVSVLIMGTNAVGKSTLARSLINEAGGISEVRGRCSYCNDGKTVVVGDYSKGKKIEGVDAFGETKCVAQMIKDAQGEIVIFEGLKCGTFGASIQDALFSAERQLIVFLYAKAEIIHQRLKERSGVGINSEQVLRQQKANLNAAIKYKEIGVPVLYYDTGVHCTDEIQKEVRKKIKELENGL